MTEWLYKPKLALDGDAPRPDHGKTLALAVDDGILCHSARNEKGYWMDNVQWIKPGHVIHLHFKQHAKAAPCLIGSFYVGDPGTARAEEGCDLALVRDEDLEQRLRAAYGMTPDERVMGWLLTPAYDVQSPSSDELNIAHFRPEIPTRVRDQRPEPVSESGPKGRILTSVSAQLPTLAAPLHFIHGPLLVTIETWSDGTVVARFPAGRISGEAHDDAAAMEALSERITEFVETHLFHAHAGKLGGTLAKQWAALTAMIDVSAERVSLDGA